MFNMNKIKEVDMNEKIIKMKAKTNPDYGCRPEDRSFEDYINNAVLCVDKPRGPTTHHIAQEVKQALSIEKIGHGGQLEPPMNGLVLVVFGNACKLTSLLTNSDREYTLRIQFSRALDQKQIERAMSKFTGKIKQVPPLRSRVRRVLRIRMVHEIQIQEYKPKNIKVYIRCESGTYLRKLFYDMGRLLRSNITLSSIRRLSIGNLKEEQAVTMEDFRNAAEAYKKGDTDAIRSILVPVEESIARKSLVVTDEAIHRLCCGSPLHLDRLCELDPGIEPEEVVVIRSLKNEIVCVAQALMSSEEMEKQTEGIAAQVTRVVMDPSTYKLPVNNHH